MSAKNAHKFNFKMHLTIRPSFSKREFILINYSENNDKMNNARHKRKICGKLSTKNVPTSQWKSEGSRRENWEARTHTNKPHFLFGVAWDLVVNTGKIDKSGKGRFSEVYRPICSRKYFHLAFDVWCDNNRSAERCKVVENWWFFSLVWLPELVVFPCKWNTVKSLERQSV